MLLLSWVKGWHHQLNGHEFEQVPGVGDGQGSLECWSSGSRKESDMTEIELKLSKRRTENWPLDLAYGITDDLIKHNLHKGREGMTFVWPGHTRSSEIVPPIPNFSFLMCDRPDIEWKRQCPALISCLYTWTWNESRPPPHTHTHSAAHTCITSSHLNGLFSKWAKTMTHALLFFCCQLLATFLTYNVKQRKPHTQVKCNMSSFALHSLSVNFRGWKTQRVKAIALKKVGALLLSPSRS